MNILFFLKPKQEVDVVYEEDTLRQVLETMEYHRYASIPLLSKDGKFIGCITEGDILWYMRKKLGANPQKIDRTPVGNLPRHRDYECVKTTERIENLIDKSVSQNFVPVIDDDECFIGIVTRSDIISYCYERMKKCGIED